MSIKNIYNFVQPVSTVQAQSSVYSIYYILIIRTISVTMNKQFKCIQNNKCIVKYQRHKDYAQSEYNKRRISWLTDISTLCKKVTFAWFA